MKKSYYLGLDIGGTKCAVSVGEIESNHIRILERSETPTTNNPTETLKHLSPCIRAYLEKYPIQAAGISCGGTADALVSGSSVERRVGSNPVIRTKNKRRMGYILRLFFIQVADLAYHHALACISSP